MDSPEETLDHALFQAVSVATTAGILPESFHVAIILPIY